MTKLTFEIVLMWLTSLIEEFQAAIAQSKAEAAQLVAVGQSAADQLNELLLVNPNY